MNLAKDGCAIFPMRNGSLVFWGKSYSNANFIDYWFPTALDVPKIEPIIVVTNDPFGPFGAKEGGAIYCYLHVFRHSQCHPRRCRNLAQRPSLYSGKSAQSFGDERKMKVERIDHISVAIKDLQRARETYEQILGMKLDCLYTMEEERIKVARYYIGDVALELMESTSPEGEVAKFIQKRGEGVFLISYRVPDVEDALAELRAKGFKLIDQQPRHFVGSRYAFINHPKELCGVLTEVMDERE